MLLNEIKLPTKPYLLVDPSKPFIHRDLSWIQFNDRVLAEARSRDNPLLKRLKFLSISTSNLDEFFMIRFASVLRATSGAKAGETKESLQRILSTILESVHKFSIHQRRTFDLLKKEAASKSVFLHLKCAKNSPEFAMGAEIFKEKILPQLVFKNKFESAKISELENLQMLAYINAEVYLEVPKSMAQIFWQIDKNTESVHAFFLDDLILSHLDSMLPNKEKSGILRITRDSDFTAEFNAEDTESVPDIVRKNLSFRDKGRLVRLQFAGEFPKDFIENLSRQLRLDPRQCFKSTGTICYNGFFSFVNEIPEWVANKPQFSNAPLSATIPDAFEKANRKTLFEGEHESDLLLHHPYDSFDAYLAWLEEACRDPDVVMIEQTIYRTGSSSKIVELLKKAAPHKKVRVCLELRARFDELNNLNVSEELSKAGAEVKFGFGKLKLHAKVALITKKIGDKTIRFTHLATGNYNEKTARQYTDISILTSNPEIGEDARHFFDAVYKNEIPTQFKQLVVAPTKLHPKIRTLIKAETEAAKEGKKARIIAKVNALVDEKIIEDLYLASQAGVNIDLIVRGACSLIPGVKGLSENIRVVSIVDRFLEHSRIYYFENSHAIYCSSADWMPRNFFSRLEIAFPILDPRLYQFISEILLPSYLKDNVKARRLTSRGIWEKVPKKKKGDENIRVQYYFEQLAVNDYKGTPLEHHVLFKRSKTN